MQVRAIQNKCFFNKFEQKNFDDNKTKIPQGKVCNCFSLPYYPIIFGSKLDNNYDEWFKAYLKSTDEKISIASEIMSILNDEKYEKFLKNKNEIKILDIGCGNGLLTEKVINGISDKFLHKKLKIDALDVNEKLLKEFDMRCTDYSKNVSVNSQNRDYFTSNFEGKYDLIIASHVLYYADDLDKAVLNIYNNLLPDGKAIIVHHSGEDCLLSELRAKYNPSSPANLEQTQEDISKTDIIKNTLEKQNIPYSSFRQFFNLTVPLDNSNDFKNLISFIIDKPYNILLKENKVVDLFNDIKTITNNQNRIRLFNNMYVITKGHKHDADF